MKSFAIRTSLLNIRYFSTIKDELERKKKFLTKIANKLELKTWKDWYGVTGSQIQKLGGTKILSNYAKRFESPTIALMCLLKETFPEHPWDEKEFEKSIDFIQKFSDKENQRKFFDSLGKKLGIKQESDWYNISLSQITQEEGGSRILHIYGNSLGRALSSLYPKFPWNYSLFYSNIDNESFNALSLKLSIKDWTDWYNISLQDIYKQEGHVIVGKHKKSIFHMVKSFLPQHPWQLWKFKDINIEDWKDLKIQREFFDWVAVYLKITQPKDWYKIMSSQIFEFGAKSFIQHYYNGFLGSAIMEVYKEHSWEVFKFAEVPKHIWENPQTRMEFLNSLSKKLNIKSYKDWYQVTPTEFTSNGGSGLLELYGNSISSVVMEIFPFYSWEISNFAQPLNGYLSDLNSQRDLLDKIGERLGIHEWTDWYKITTSDVIKNGGNTLLSYYGNQFIELLKSVYPQHNWKIWKFEKIPNHWFHEPQNVRSFFEDLFAHLEFRSIADFYTLSFEEIKSHGGAAILDYYKTIPKAISAAYPEHKWNLDFFDKTSEGYLSDLSIQKQLVEKIGKQLNIQKMEDWYFVNLEDFTRHGGGTLLYHYYENSIQSLLMTLYPNFNWDQTKSRHYSRTVPSKSQYRLFRLLHNMLPDIPDMHMNYIVEDLKFTSLKSMELDIFIPSLKIAFEYHGLQHFKLTSRFSDTSIEERKRKDSEKREACKEAGISIVEVPYLWNGTKEGLMEIIKQQEPEIVKHFLS